MRQIIITAVVTAILSFTVGITIFHYTEKSPELTYEIFPVSSFPKENAKLSIFFVKIENSGNKEVENVQSVFVFPKDAKIVDHSIELSSVAIKLNPKDEISKNLKSFLIPTFNPSENCKFSFLVETPSDAKLEIGLRGKGITGVQKKPHIPLYENHPLRIFTDIFMIVILTLFLFALLRSREFRDAFYSSPDKNTKKQKEFNKGPSEP